MGKMLEGRVAIVTGGGRGLGRSIALRLSRDGAAVAVLSRTAAQVDAVAAEIRSAGGRAIGFACDLTASGSPAAAVDRVAGELGPVDILVNNAHDTAVASMTGAVETVGEEQLISQMRSGPYVALALMQACIPHMKAQGGGRIINMASGVGTNRMRHFLPYAMAKEALRAMTGVAARELGEFGITINAICPAADTESARDTIASGVVGGIGKSKGGGGARPIGRMGDPDGDVAPLVAFLAGPESGYLTGYTYMVDGGGSIDAGR